MHRAWATAVVGWYFMIPMQADLMTEPWRRPLAEWLTWSSYDTGAECQAAKNAERDRHPRGYRCSSSSREEYARRRVLAVDLSLCIASNDPRLRPTSQK